MPEIQKVLMKLMMKNNKMPTIQINKSNKTFV